MLGSQKAAATHNNRPYRIITQFSISVNNFFPAEHKYSPHCGHRMEKRGHWDADKNFWSILQRSDLYFWRTAAWLCGRCPAGAAGRADLRHYRAGAKPIFRPFGLQRGLYYPLALHLPHRPGHHFGGCKAGRLPLHKKPAKFFKINGEKVPFFWKKCLQIGNTSIIIVQHG